MVKVLHIIGRLGNGGDSKIINDVRKKINSELIRFDFLTFELIQNDIVEDIQNSKSQIFVIENGDLRKCGIIKYIDNLKKFFNTHSEYDYIHIHVGMQSGLIAYIIKKMKLNNIIVHAHTTTLQRKTNFIKKIIITPVLRKLINKFADVKIACGKDAGVFLFGKNTEFLIIHNGIELINNNFSSIKDELKISSKEIVITQVGSFQYMKNQDFTIDFFENISKDNCTLIFVGTGDATRYAAEKIEKNKKIMKLGRRKDVMSILRETNIFVMPSKSGEGLPISLIEAQLMGCYCLVSNMITKEADLNLGLIKWLPIDNIDLWVDSINSVNIPNVTYEDRITRIKELKFDIDSTVDSFYYLYGCEGKVK